ncbi:gp41 protein [Mycolicibacterium mageritense DSM 44476 = CIP 104973]|uniref:Integrase n=1 Tax=Mycolicibacterium mageritense TaxID=53462 RepID=A0ABM7I3Z2_MYCME|nr:tyrosine-type recombinase/integrase [Mycolicibacterium mageritense]BBX37619.1 integrase [Mycolicibacterium mageritense]CDO25717.1 gp41 protein [Mycolicibacterium mageritense DSM 44476 = CIP 104973]
MARIPHYVKIVTTKGGEARYQVRIETGKVDGKRHQGKRNFKKLQDAIDAYSEARGDRSRGVQVTPSGVTLRQAADAYLDALNARPNTRTAYAAVLRPAIERLGDRPVQELRRDEIEKLVTDISTKAVPSGDWHKPSKLPAGVKETCGPWAPGSIKHMLSRLGAVYGRLIEDGTVLRSPLDHVKGPARVKRAKVTLTVAQCQHLFDHLESTRDRLEHMHHLALQAGMRRGELAGLKWDDIDLEAETMTVARQRVHSEAGAVEADTKTDAGRRTLPIPSTLLPVLKRAVLRSEAEQKLVGNRWQGDGTVVCDELGRAYYPTTLSYMWRNALADAGLPHVRLHDARHTCGTLMHLNGVPIAVIAAVLGHTDASFTQRVYAHSQEDAVTQGMAVYARVLETREKAAT